MIYAQLGDLGFFFPGMESLFKSGGDKKEEKKEEPKKDISAFLPTICPAGMTPNPQWTSLPSEAKGQAAAAGVQACLEAPKVKVKLGCKITVGSRKFKCDQGEFDRARRYAQRAMRRPLAPGAPPGARKPRALTVHIGKETIMFRPWPRGGGLAPGGAPGVQPQVPGQPCPPGTVPAVDSANQPVCAPAAAMGPGGGGAPAGAGAAAARRDRRGHRRRGRGRGGRGGRYGGRGGDRFGLYGLGESSMIASTSPLVGGILLALVGGALILASRAT